MLVQDHENHISKLIESVEQRIEFDNTPANKLFESKQPLKEWEVNDYVSLEKDKDRKPIGYVLHADGRQTTVKIKPELRHSFGSQETVTFDSEELRSAMDGKDGGERWIGQNALTTDEMDAGWAKLPDEQKTKVGNDLEAALKKGVVEIVYRRKKDDTVNHYELTMNDAYGSPYTPKNPPKEPKEPGPEKVEPRKTLTAWHAADSGERRHMTFVLSRVADWKPVDRRKGRKQANTATDLANEATGGDVTLADLLNLTQQPIVEEPQIEASEFSPAIPGHPGDPDTPAPEAVEHGFEVGDVIADRRRPNKPVGKITAIEDGIPLGRNDELGICLHLAIIDPDADVNWLGRDDTACAFNYQIKNGHCPFVKLRGRQASHESMRSTLDMLESALKKKV